MTVKQRVACDAMSKVTILLCAWLAVVAVFLMAAADGAGADGAAAPLITPPPLTQRLAYLTETTTGTPNVWVAAANGSDRKLLGPGQQPLLAPSGEAVAVSLFGATGGNEEHGPSIGIYPATGGPIADYLSLETATATPLAWSPDSRYLAVYRQSNQVTDIAASSGLDVIDTQTGTVYPIAAGVIYGASFARDGSDRLVFGLSHSLSVAASANLYESEADGAGLRRVTNDGRSLNPVWGPSYIAYDRERLRHLSPEYQIWLAAPTGTPVRKVTHVPVGPLVAGLVPLEFSADGLRLLAEFEGEDTSSAYAVSVSSGRARGVTVHNRTVQGAGISSDGSTLLVDENSFEQSSSDGRVSLVPFAGGHATVLVAHGSQGSWNR
jgi:Tol biopolymer transport system component